MASPRGSESIKLPRHKSNSTTPRPKMSIDFPKEEERILKRWEEIDAFLTQVELVCTPTTLRMHMFGRNKGND
jgi:hypothetical protein